MNDNQYLSNYKLVTKVEKLKKENEELKQTVKELKSELIKYKNKLEDSYIQNLWDKILQKQQLTVTTKNSILLFQKGLTYDKF